MILDHNQYQELLTNVLKSSHFVLDPDVCPLLSEKLQQESLMRHEHHHKNPKIHTTQILLADKDYKSHKSTSTSLLVEAAKLIRYHHLEETTNSNQTASSE